MQQLYFVAILAEGEILRKAENLKREISERFSTRAALKSPAHITLFPPFHFDPAHEQMLHDALKESAKDRRSFELSLDGFGTFPEQTIFIRVISSELLEQLYEKVQSVFTSFPGSKLKRETRPFHPHMTIGNRDWEAGEFEEAKTLLDSRGFSAGMTVHQLSLLRLDHGKWQIAFQQQF